MMARERRKANQLELALCGGVGVSESCAFVQCMFGPCGVCEASYT
jgi:hypothetical protein